MNKIAVYLTKDELNYLQHILWHFTDYMGGDNRPDHGLGILKEYRNIEDDKKHLIYSLAGKLRRRYRNIPINNKYV